MKKPKAAGTNSGAPLVGVIMGSTSDWETMEHAANTLRELGVPDETRVVSAQRTPDLLVEYASTAEKRGIEVIIAGAGGAAHLPGMAASKTVLPVLGVPVESKALKGLDSLLSIAQMPGGIPVGTLAIGKAGSINAALLAAAFLGSKQRPIRGAPAAGGGGKVSGKTRARVSAGDCIGRSARPAAGKAVVSPVGDSHDGVCGDCEARRSGRGRKGGWLAGDAENMPDGLRRERTVAAANGRRCGEGAGGNAP